MGSYDDLSIDGFSIWGSKSYVDDAVLSIFHERDRRRRVASRPRYSNSGAEEVVEYAVSARAMRERLDAMGYAAAQAREDYAIGLNRELEVYDVHLTDVFDQELRERAAQWTYDRWSAAIARLVPQGFQVWAAERFKGDRDAVQISSGMQQGLGSHFSDIRLMLRALLDALPAAQEVILDVTDLISAGYYEEDEPICAQARRAWANENSVYGPIILLTEGRSDARILLAAFQAIAPHLIDLYGFLDFEGLKIEGSADALAKMIRAFVGAGISSRIIGIFDRDTAGAEALAGLASVDLPPHVKVMALPECEIAKSYPTLGPQGPAEMDVNHLACSIEMYLGLDALRDEMGRLRPVRWTGFNGKLRRYQGAVGGKDEIATRFFALLQQCGSELEARAAFPDLARAIDAIAAAFIATPPGSRGQRADLSEW